MRFDPKEEPSDQGLIEMLKRTAQHMYMNVVKDTAGTKLGVRCWAKEIGKGKYLFKFDINWEDVEMYFEEFISARAQKIYIWCMGVEFSKAVDESEIHLHIDEREVVKGERAPAFFAEFDKENKEWKISRAPWS